VKPAAEKNYWLFSQKVDLSGITLLKKRFIMDFEQQRRF